MAQTSPAAAEWWAKAGLMEHASIAAFARFAMDLLQLGAPPDLLRDTARAMEDEIRHATLCFSIAAELSGSTQSPGPFDAAKEFVRNRTPEDILVSAIQEGCIEETVAAEVAREIAKRAKLDRIREVGEEIADDESRHADLAWRFVAWLLAKRPDLRPLAASSFEQTIVTKESAEDQAESDGPNLEGFGRLRPSTLRQARRRAMQAVVCSRLADLRLETELV